MNKTELVTVVIPSYKQRGLLVNAVKSALSQSYPNLEVIVVDDNPADSIERKETEELMLQFEGDSRVVYIKHPVNKNGAAARNTGIKAANGNYIAFLDDDDEWRPDKIQKQMDYLSSHNNYGAVYTYRLVDGKKSPSRAYEGDLIVPFLMLRASIQTSSLLFHKEVLDDIGGFDESFRRHQDYELLVKFFLKGYQIGCIPEYLTEMHSIGGNRLSGLQLNELKAKFLNTFEKDLQDLDKKNPGLRNKIIVANYVEIMDSHLAAGNIKLALQIIRDYFLKSPTTFISQTWFMAVNHLKRKL